MASDLKSVITARFQKICDAYNAYDLKAVTSIYAKDFRLVVPGESALPGVEMLQEGCKQMKEGGLKMGKAKVLEVRGSPDGNMVYSIIRLDTLNADGSSAGKTNSVMIWQKVNGNYVVQVEVNA